MRARHAIVLALALLAPPGLAVESTDWPPSPEVLARMRELQETMSDPAKSKQERAAARSELERLMKVPGAPERKPDAKKPARAAIDPYPSVAKPADAQLLFPSKPLTEPPPTARLEVLDEPRKPAVDPRTGSVILPSSPGFGVDPKTGRMLHETPGGYVDPRTGNLIPKPR